MKSLIKRSKLFRWLAPNAVSPESTGRVSQSDRTQPGRPRLELFPRLYPSQLEPRIVLNASPVVQLDPNGVLEIDAGEFADDGIADTFDVQLAPDDADTINVSVNGTVIYTGSVADVQSIQINGSGDADQLTLDAAVLDRVSVAFDPGSPTECRDSVLLSASAGGSWQAVSVDLTSAGGDVHLTRNDGVLSAALSFTGTVDVIDSLAVADRTLSLGDLTSVIITGQDGGMEVQSAVGTLLVVHADQAAWEIDASGGLLQFEGTLELLSLDARAENLTVNGTLTATAGALAFDASDDFQLEASAYLITSEHSITIQAEQITLAGTIEARDGGDVFATAGENGTLRLSGLIDASDERADGTGGRVYLDGGQVILSGTAEVNVSGTTGGGEIQIGGSRHDDATAAPSTTLSFIGPGTRLIADALQSGDGGQVVLWSDDSTLLAGTISARGGASSGNGGSIEVSGKQRFWFDGQIDTSASHGQAGTLLLDPITINIVAGAPGSGTLDEELTLSDPAILEAVLDAGGNTLSVGQLQSLGAGTNIVLEATSLITVLAPLDLDLGAAGSLTLRATAGAVVLNAEVNITGGDFVVEALTTISVNNSLQAVGGDITFTAAQILLNGTVLTSGAGALTINGDVLVAGNSELGVETGNLIVSGTIDGPGNLVITADSGDIQLQGAVGDTIALASLIINSAGTIDFQDSVTTTGTQQITADTIHVAEVHRTGNALLSIHGNVVLQHDTVFSTAGGNLVLDSVTGGGHDLQLISGAGTTTVTGTLSGIDELTLQQNAASATGAVAFQGNLSVNTLITFARNYSVSLTGTTTHITNAVTFANTGGVTLGDGADELNFSGGLTSLASTTFVDGTVTTANQQMTIGNLRVAGDSVLNTGGGDFQITGSLNSTGNGIATSDEYGLTVSTGTGDATFLGTIGGASDGALGSLQVTARSIEVANIGTLGSVGVVGATQFTAQTGITLTGSVMRTAGGQRYVGPVTIDSSGDLLIVTTGGGASDRIQLSGNIGHVAGWNSQLTVRTAGTSDIEFAAAVDLAGDVLFDAGGDLTVSGTLNSGGTLTLLGSNIELQEIHSGGAVSITADNAIVLGGDLDAGNQTIVVRANQDLVGNQGLTQAAATTIRTTNAASDAIQIIVGGSGNASLGTLLAESGGAHVQAGGMILSNGAALDIHGNAVNVITNDLVLTSRSGIALSTDVQTLDATITAAGDLQIDQFNRNLTVKNLALSAGDAALTSDAEIVLQSLSLPAHELALTATNIRFEQPVANVHDLTVNASGTVDFLAALATTGSVVVDATGDITFHGTINLGGGLDVRGQAVTLTQDVVTSGAIRISAQNELLVGVNIDAGAATITLLANQDQTGDASFVQAFGTLIRTTSAASNAITIGAGGTGDVLLASVEAGAGGVSVTAGGEIVDYGPPGASVRAHSLTATATNGIDLHTDIDVFSGTVSGSGTLRLVEADTLQISSIHVAGGDVSLSADALSMGSLVTTGSVALTARTGAITDGNGGLLNITADSLTISSVHGVDLDTRVSTLDLTLSGSGNVHLEQSNRALTVVNLVVPDGDVSLLSNADVTLQSFDILAHHLSVAGANVTFETAVQGLSDLTVAATEDVLFQAAIDITQALDVDADGDVTFQAPVILGGSLSLIGDQVWFAESLSTGGSIQVSAKNELRFSGDIDASDQTISLRANQDGAGTQSLVVHGTLKTLNLSANSLVIHVGGSGSVLVDHVEVGGRVSIEAGGALRGFNQATTEIQAASLQVITGTGMDVWTTAMEVSAEVTQTGDILMTVADAVTAERLVTHNGSIEFVSGNTMWLGIVTAGSGGDVALTAQAGAILALAGDPAISLVRANRLTMTAPGDIALLTDVNTLTATITGSGSLTIDNQGALSVVTTSVHDGSAAITAASLEIGSITAPGSVALTANDGGILGIGDDTHVSTTDLILLSSSSINLITNVDFLLASITQDGNLHISDIGQLQVNLATVSHGAIDLEAAQELVIAGGVVAEQGQISLDSTHSHLRFVNPNMGTTLLIYSGGPDARIEGSAAGDVIITGPGVVLFRTPVSQYFTVRPELTVTADDVPFFTDVQVTPDGWTTLRVSFGEANGPEEYHFRLIIDWGDSVETITSASSNSGYTFLQRAGEGSGELIFMIQHQYASNPDPHDPTAPIPISVLASNSLSNGGPADIVFFADGNRTDPLVTQTDLVLNVPANGLTISFTPVLPPAAESRVVEPTPLIVEPSSSTMIVDSSRSTQPLVTSTQSFAVYERYYVLRIVVQIDEEGNTRELADIRIDDDYLRNLPKLFEMLPDDRYRLYQIREDGVAQLITDVIIRGGKSAGTLDLEEGLDSLEDKGSTLNDSQPPSELPADSREALPGELSLQPSLFNDPQGPQTRLITKAGVLQLRN